MARPLVAVLLLIFSVLSHAPAADVDEIKTKVYVSPYLQDVVTGFPTPLPKLKGGFVDLRDYLAMRGIELPAKGDALYDPKARTVTVRAPEDVIEKISQHWHDAEPVAVRAVFTVVEFSATDAVDFPDLAYEELRKLAGDSWRVKDRVTVIGHSGQKVTGGMIGKNTRPGKAVVPKKDEEINFFNAPTSANLSGTTVEIEPQISSDEVTVDFSFAYAYRSRATGDQPSILLRSQSNVSLMDQAPLVLQTATLTPPKGETSRGPARELAVVVEVSLIDRAGRQLNPKPAQPASVQPTPKR